MSQNPLHPILNKYIPYVPTERQQAALIFYGRELLYGGAAGGGKSDWMLMAALQFCHFPDYSAVIFRRTFAQLSANDGLLPLAMDWLTPTDATGAEALNGYYTRWDFPSGAVLKFSHMQTLKDRFNHQGPRYDFAGYDELTQFLRPMYLYLFSRLRRAEGSKIPPRMRAATNPGGEGHDWVQERFEIPDHPTDEMHQGPNGRMFLPAKIIDNPHLDRAIYLESLAELDPVDRKRLEEGDWAVREAGDVFQREWFDIVNIGPAHPVITVRRWDLAATVPKPGTDPDYTVGVRMSRTGYGKEEEFWIEDVIRFRKSPGPTRAIVYQTSRLDGIEVVVGIPQDPGATGKDAVYNYRLELLDRTVRDSIETGSKSARAGAIANAAQAGRVHLIKGDWNKKFLDELDLFFSPGVHDDQVDAVSGAYVMLTKYIMTMDEMYSEEPLPPEEQERIMAEVYDQ